MKIKYSSNNSGGSWRLTDDDWIRLEIAGWTVDWHKNSSSSVFVDDDGRFLGALASKAFKKFSSLDEAIEEWEAITGQDAEEQGCECCGQPHNFYQE